MHGNHPKTYSFSLPQDLVRGLEERIDRWTSSKSGQLVQDLSDYYALLSLGRKQIKRKLTQGQVKAVLDALNAVFLQPGDLVKWGGGVRSGRTDCHSVLAHEMADACDLDQIHVKWQIDRAELLQTIEGLSPLEHVALVDWVRYMWSRYQDNELWERELSQFRS